MKQLPNPTSGEQTIRVVMDESELNRLLSPVFKEVNELRARVKALEEGYVEQVGLTGFLERRLDGLLDDGR